MTDKLTKWEAGQCLIAAADALWEDEQDLRKAGHRKLAAVLKDCRLTIGDHFNNLGAHDFGLADHDHPRKERRAL
jgi:hypothetical protein